MINPDDAELGTTIYLRPHTKQAPAECYRRLAAVLVSTQHWPMCVVRVFDVDNGGHGREIKVHRDNIGLRRRTTAKRDKQGDMAGNSDDNTSGMVGKRLARPVPPIDPASGYEEPMLF